MNLWGQKGKLTSDNIAATINWQDKKGKLEIITAQWLNSIIITIQKQQSTGCNNWQSSNSNQCQKQQ